VREVTVSTAILRLPDGSKVEPTADQLRMLQAIRDYSDYDERGPWVLIHGYAGTGKTTVVQALQHLCPEWKILYLAYTGRAALQLRRKGCPSAMTIHKAIYRPKCHDPVGAKKIRDDYADGLITAKKRDELLAPLYEPLEWELNPESPVATADLVVVDECSMVSATVAEDLLSFGTPIVVLGDPHQLPPILNRDDLTEDGWQGGYFDRRDAAVVLTDITRQKQDNPILRISEQARTMGIALGGDYGDAVRFTNGSARITDQQLLAADQVICGTYKTIRRLTTRMRQALGHMKGGTPEDWLPKVGEKVVGLMNTRDGLVNGRLYRVTAVKEALDEDDCPYDDRLNLTIVPLDVDQEGIDKGDETAIADALPLTVQTHVAPFLCDHPREYQEQSRERTALLAYGYAITVHKSQGSEWDNLVLVDDGFGLFDFQYTPDLFQRTRWLYTGVTRAAKRLTYVVGFGGNLMAKINEARSWRAAQQRGAA
jgi:exodeoxyribonuclease V